MREGRACVGVDCVVAIPVLEVCMIGEVDVDMNSVHSLGA